MVLVVTVAEQGTTRPWAFLNSVEIFLFIMGFFSQVSSWLALVVIIFFFFPSNIFSVRDTQSH